MAGAGASVLYSITLENLKWRAQSYTIFKEAAGTVVSMWGRDTLFQYFNGVVSAFIPNSMRSLYNLIMPHAFAGIIYAFLTPTLRLVSVDGNNRLRPDMEVVRGAVCSYAGSILGARVDSAMGASAGGQSTDNGLTWM